MPDHVLQFVLELYEVILKLNLCSRPTLAGLDKSKYFIILQYLSKIKLQIIEFKIHFRNFSGSSSIHFSGSILKQTEISKFSILLK